MRRRSTVYSPEVVVSAELRDHEPLNGPIATIDHISRVLLDRVPADVWCGVLLDPSTLLDTGGQHEAGFPAELMPRLFELEHVEQDDVDNLRALTVRQSPVSVLSISTDGNLGTSKYYREILRPVGLADELRVLLRDGNRVWGLLVLCRSASSGFTAADIEWAAAISSTGTGLLRRTLLLSGLDDGAVPDAPGYLVLHEDQTVMQASPTAAQWLADLHEQRRDPTGLPYAVSALTARVRALPRGEIATSRARGRSGRWISLRAWSADADGGVAVALDSVQPRELIPMVLDAYRLTERERDVTQCVLLGRSTEQIAASLFMSPHTVQDHLKSIFAKTGVRSRRDLVAEVFLKQYLPYLPAPVRTTDGRLRHRSRDTA